MNLDDLLKRKEELEAGRSQAINNYNVVIGQLAECEIMINLFKEKQKIDDPEIPPVE